MQSPCVILNAGFLILQLLNIIHTEKLFFAKFLPISSEIIFLLYNGHLGTGLSTNAEKIILPPTLNGKIIEKISRCQM